MTVMDFRKGRGKVADDDEFDADLVAECREIGIDQVSIRAGGDYRQLTKGQVYWLPLKELLEFEKHDLSTPDDEEFFTWFNGFVKEHQFETRSERTGKSHKSWGDWKGKFDEWKPKKISNFWSDWGYDSKSYSGTDSELVKKLAIALKAVSSTVAVINDTGAKFRVKFASEDTGESPSSYTDFTGKEIVVSPQALLDTSIDSDLGIEITTGWALHEGSHVKYSTSVFDDLKKPSALEPASVGHLLWNLLEDIRIESLTAAQFPGFAEFFTTHNKYLWNLADPHKPKEWGPELQQKLGSVILMTKWPNEYEPTAMADPRLAEEFPWWQTWWKAYLDGSKDMRKSLIEALDHLNEDPETKKQMQERADEEKKAGDAQKMNKEQFEKFLEQLKEMFKGGLEPCPSPGQQPDPTGKAKSKMELTDEQATELENLLEQQYQTHEAEYKMKEGNHEVAPEIESTRPVEDAYSKAMYKTPGGMVERMRSAFFFRKKATTEAERLLKSGMVDEEELWRVGAGDTRVFERETTPEETYTSVTMLVDASGSMYGGGLDRAQALATTMMACLRTQRGVRVRVRAHSTGYTTGGASCKIYRIWEPGDPDTRLGLLNTIDHGSNFDGFAIDWCAQELAQTSLPNESMLLIVLSDGLPAGSWVSGTRAYHYGGSRAMEHMMAVSKGWAAKGVTIVQIAIDPSGLRPEDQAKMFLNWIGYESDNRLLVDLTNLLKKVFGGVE
jgi:hypothetical protein